MIERVPPAGRRRCLLDTGIFPTLKWLPPTGAPNRATISKTLRESHRTSNAFPRSRRFFHSYNPCSSCHLVFSVLLFHPGVGILKFLLHAGIVSSGCSFSPSARSRTRFQLGAECCDQLVELLLEAIAVLVACPPTTAQTASRIGHGGDQTAYAPGRKLRTVPRPSAGRRPTPATVPVVRNFQAV